MYVLSNTTARTNSIHQLSLTFKKIHLNITHFNLTEVASQSVTSTAKGGEGGFPPMSMSISSSPRGAIFYPLTLKLYYPVIYPLILNYLVDKSNFKKKAYKKHTLEYFVS